MNYGFAKSKIDGKEIKFGVQKNLEIPDSYSYKKYLPKVIDQGSRPICVPCSISAYINWSENIETGENKKDNNIDYESIYKIRTTPGNDGMTFKDAFKFLQEKGVKTDNGIVKIGRYAMIGSHITLKQAIILNGPCFGALPVYNQYRKNFWNKHYSDSFIGGHAISIVGYNNEGFIIRNSWGKKYGDEGYSILPYDDFKQFYEVWTIID